MADRDLKKVTAMRRGLVCLPITFTFADANGTVQLAPNTIDGVSVEPLEEGTGLQVINLDERWNDFVGVDVAIMDGSYSASCVPYVIVKEFQIGTGSSAGHSNANVNKDNYIILTWVKAIHSGNPPVGALLREDVFNSLATPQGTTMHVNLWLTMAGDTEML